MILIVFVVVFLIFVVCVVVACRLITVLIRVVCAADSFVNRWSVAVAIFVFGLVVVKLVFLGG